jgi:tetrahydromethanopterin S-methyltransferase subunit D
MVALLDPVTLTNIFLIAISGTLICLAVHFIPVGGAPAAMAQATGIGTGTVELAAGSGLVGLITASYMYAQPGASLALTLAAGATGSMVMLASTMLAGGLVYAFGVGTPFASAQVKYDPITRERQDIYVARGTQGQGIPTVCFVSGVIGAAFGGIGGALIYYILMGIYSPLISTTSAVAVAGVFTMGVFYVNSVIPSYGVGGTIEGFHDQKFKKVVPKDTLTSFAVSLLMGVIAVLIAGGM